MHGKDCDGRTALMDAVEYDSDHIMKKLASVTDVSIQDKNGDTVLINLIKSCNEDEDEIANRARFLLSFDSKIATISNIYDKSPLDLPRKERLQGMVDAIVEVTVQQPQNE